MASTWKRPPTQSSTALVPPPRVDPEAERKRVAAEAAATAERERVEAIAAAERAVAAAAEETRRIEEETRLRIEREAAAAVERERVLLHVLGSGAAAEKFRLEREFMAREEAAKIAFIPGMSILPWPPFFRQRTWKHKIGNCVANLFLQLHFGVAAPVRQTTTKFPKANAACALGMVGFAKAASTCTDAACFQVSVRYRYHS